ncbi:MAG: FMN-dependent NADH-azoreductase, partial [Pedobacter sp.]
MIRILHIISSPKGSRSITKRLGNAIVARIKTGYSGNVLVDELDLANDPFPHITPLQLDAFHTPFQQRTEEQAIIAAKSENAIRQLYEADIIVIGAPMHNYSVPSALKTYIDHIVRAGVTFGFSQVSKDGLFKNKKAYIAFSSGWNFSDRELQPYDFCVPYLKAVLNLIGIKEIGVFRIEGAAGPLQKEATLATVITDMV